MMQQRGAGDGEVGDQPAGDDIAEIDDAVRHQSAFPVGPGDHVVIGDVVMDRLHPKLAGERLDALDRRHHGLGDPVALRMVGHGLQQVQRDRAGSAKVPLQFTVEPWMGEILEAERDAGGQRSQFGHDLRRRYLRCVSGSPSR